MIPRRCRLLSLSTKPHRYRLQPLFLFSGVHRQKQLVVHPSKTQHLIISSNASNQELLRASVPVCVKSYEVVPCHRQLQELHPSERKAPIKDLELQHARVLPLLAQDKETAVMIDGICYSKGGRIRGRRAAPRVLRSKWKACRHSAQTNTVSPSHPRARGCKQHTEEPCDTEYRFKCSSGSSSPKLSREWKADQATRSANTMLLPGMSLSRQIPATRAVAKIESFKILRMVHLA